MKSPAATLETKSKEYPGGSWAEKDLEKLKKCIDCGAFNRADKPSINQEVAGHSFSRA